VRLGGVKSDRGGTSAGNGGREGELADVTVKGVPVVARVHVDAADVVAAAFPVVGEVMPADEDFNAGGGEAFAAVGGGKDGVGVDESAAAELSVEGRVPLPVHGNKEGILGGGANLDAANNVGEEIVGLDGLFGEILKTVDACGDLRVDPAGVGVGLECVGTDTTFKKVEEGRHTGVDTISVGLGAAIAPGNNADEDLLYAIVEEDGATRVTLAGVLATSGEAGTKHALSNLTVVGFAGVADLVGHIGYINFLGLGGVLGRGGGSVAPANDSQHLVGLVERASVKLDGGSSAGGDGGREGKVADVTVESTSVVVLVHRNAANVGAGAFVVVFEVVPSDKDFNCGGAEAIAAVSGSGDLVGSNECTAAKLSLVSAGSLSAKGDKEVVLVGRGDLDATNNVGEDIVGLLLGEDAGSEGEESEDGGRIEHTHGSSSSC
jgi:hypothetical protein